jgi:hypothetical protein
MPGKLIDLEEEERIKQERERQLALDAGGQRRSAGSESDEEAISSGKDSPQNRRHPV